MRRNLGILLAVILLSACTEIPTTGPVTEVTLESEPRGVQIIAKPPEPGVTPVRLVENFVQAMADPGADYAVARQYLTEASAPEWDPREGGSVYRGVVSEQSGAVLARGIETGFLDADGRFTATGSDMSHDFGVLQEEGEWRISIPPKGVLVSDYIFERYWSHVTVFFGSVAETHVVPDLVHIPDALLTPERIVKTLVAGPSPGIADAVTNPLAPSVGLAAKSANVDAEGTVLVALTGLDTSMSEERRSLLGAQLLWSLTAIPRVTGLQILNDGRAYQLPDQNADGVLELTSQQRFQMRSRTATSDLFGVRDGVGVRIDAAGDVLPMSTEDTRVSEVAVSIDQTLVGFINESRTEVFMGPLGGTLASVSPGLSNLRSAQFALGNLWLLGDDAEGVSHLVRIDGQGDVSEVDTSELDGGLVDFSVSQAGVRLVAVVEKAGTHRLLTSAIAEGERPRLNAVDELALLIGRIPLSNYEGLDWSGETELIVVAESSSGASIHRARLDGSLVEDLGPLSEQPVQVSALQGLDDSAVVIRSDEDGIFRHDANKRWTRLDESLQDVTYPG
ncbi:MAG: GerMN domain-containing protein [Arachnia sp.]